MSLRPLGTTQAAHPDIEVIEGALTLLPLQLRQLQFQLSCRLQLQSQLQLQLMLCRLVCAFYLSLLFNQFSNWISNGGNHDFAKIRKICGKNPRIHENLRKI